MVATTGLWNEGFETRIDRFTAARPVYRGGGVYRVNRRFSAG
ncbi:MAG: hypothetical protein NTZ32_11975 [Planctomycetales bacterium]|nr:hypothetical protein [Planctomycetales bacterium]